MFCTIRGDGTPFKFRDQKKLRWKGRTWMLNNIAQAQTQYGIALCSISSQSDRCQILGLVWAVDMYGHFIRSFFVQIAAPLFCTVLRDEWVNLQFNWPVKKCLSISMIIEVFGKRLLHLAMTGSILAKLLRQMATGVGISFYVVDNHYKKNVPRLKPINICLTCSNLHSVVMTVCAFT